MDKSSKKTNTVQSTALILMVLTVLSKVFGFVREMVLSYLYGANVVSDAYVVAMSVPIVLIGIFSNGITTSYIPMYSSILESSNKRRADRFTSNLVNVVFVIATLAIIFGQIFTTPLVKIFAFGFEGEALSLAVEFTRFSLFSIYALLISAVFRGYLNLHDEFVVPAVTGFILNVIIIASMILSKLISVHILGVGLFLANTLQYVIFIKPIKKAGYRHKKIFDLKSKHLRELLRISIPVMIGVAVMEVNNVADKFFASFLVTGAITNLNYAQKLSSFVSGIVIVSITTASYPEMSRYGSTGDLDGLKKSSTASIGLTNFLVFPAAIGLMALAHPIMDMLFGRGAITPADVNAMSGALFWYGPMLMAQGARDILNRSFYAIKDTKTPMIISSIMVVINIILDGLFLKPWGLSGLSAATSLATVIGMLMMYVVFRKEIGQFGFKALLINYIKVGFAAALMGIATHFVYAFLARQLPAVLALAGSMVVAVVVYAVLVLVLRVEEVDKALNLVKSKIGRK